MNELIKKGELGKKAAYVLGNSSSKEKNKALENIASKLIEKYEIILDANKIDTDLAKKREFQSHF